jgi:phenylalanyl-tRNA synthetase beta chain
MLISRNWLQKYFQQELPIAQEIADTLMLHAFEIEDVFEKKEDWIIDIDVLPNRAHDCLSHFGVAQEISRLFNISLKKSSFSELQKNNAVPVEILNVNQCTRYQATRINNINVSNDDCFSDFLTSLGQKKINNIVNISNVVMFDYGQPTHVFDADKVVGVMSVRNAINGESMETLSGEQLTLIESDLVISDEKGVLALAGVKGGIRAEVTNLTKNIIIEVANFDSITTRKTARRVKIFTDSSKRYENKISAEKVDYAMKMMVSLVQEFASTTQTKVVGTTDIYPSPELQQNISLELKHIQRVLGLEINQEQVSEILDRYNYSYIFDNDRYTIIIPFDRIDLRICEDIIEEIGRIYGYYNIPSKSVHNLSFVPRINQNVYTTQKLTNILIDSGYTEIMSYTFVSKGEVNMINPLASDKGALRIDLHQQMSESLKKNIHSIDYFGLDRVALFEIGQVYKSSGESTLCCVGITNKNKSSKKKYGSEDDQLIKIQKTIEESFEVSLNTFKKENTLSFDITELINKNTERFGTVFHSKSFLSDAIFHTVSVYPYMTRDVSFWAPSGKSAKDYESIIIQAGAIYFKKVFLFDEFEKNGRTSYAFSMIFQSDKKTLIEQDVELDMKKIVQFLEVLGCEVR